MILVETNGGAGGKVVGHKVGAAAEEGEGAGAHALHADGDQFRNAAFIALVDKVKDVAVFGEFQCGVVLAGYFFAEAFSFCLRHGKAVNGGIAHGVNPGNMVCELSACVHSGCTSVSVCFYLS